MKLPHIKTFVTVAEEGTVSKAALRLRIAQPALSRQISDFEDELGLRLSDRVRRRLVPFLFADGPGSEIQRPLAVVVIGGLVTATSLTLVLLPILYDRFALPRAEKRVLEERHAAAVPVAAE